MKEGEMMKAVSFKLNTVLAAVVGLTCLLLVLLRTFAPEVLLPELDVPNLVAVCVIALVVDCYIDWKKPVPERSWVMTAVFAALTFWLLPWASGLTAGAGDALRIGAIGGVFFLALAFAFTGIRQKISSGPAGTGWLAFVSPAAAGAVLYLAFQSFAAVLL